MAWLLLVVAGVLEIGWPLGFKLASVHEKYFYLFIDHNFTDTRLVCICIRKVSQ